MKRSDKAKAIRERDKNNHALALSFLSLRREFDKERREVESDIRKRRYQFARDNNPYKVGDVIQDQVGYGRIIKTKVTAGYKEKDVPQCVYYCQNLNLKFKPSKTEPERRILQQNVICKVDEPNQ